MAEARSRGYFGIGVEGVSKSANVGALLRTAHAFGAAFCFIVGPGWDARASRLADTPNTPDHVPFWRFPDIGSLQLPQHCVLVGVELLDTATDLPSFRHPMNAAYVLGPERSGLSPEMLERCRHVVRIPTRFALNLAVVGALVLYRSPAAAWSIRRSPGGQPGTDIRRTRIHRTWRTSIPPQHP